MASQPAIHINTIILFTSEMADEECNVPTERILLEEERGAKAADMSNMHDCNASELRTFR